MPMQHFNTLNDLILFAYSESIDPKANDYYKVINANQKLSSEFKAIIKVKNYLSILKVGPSESVIKNIMNYSKALSVGRTKSAGEFSLMLN
jgi:hypothetical protein